MSNPIWWCSTSIVMFDKYCIDLESSVLLIVMGRSCIFTRRSGILPSSYPKSMIPISTMTGWWTFAYCLVCDDVVSGTVAGKIRRVIESFVITVRYRSFDWRYLKLSALQVAEPWRRSSSCQWFATSQIRGHRDNLITFHRKQGGDSLSCFLQEWILCTDVKYWQAKRTDNEPDLVEGIAATQPPCRDKDTSIEGSEKHPK